MMRPTLNAPRVGHFGAWLALVVALVALLAASCATSTGTWGCPGGTLNQCPDGHTEVCETTDKGRCCTCERSDDASSRHNL